MPRRSGRKRAEAWDFSTRPDVFAPKWERRQSAAAFDFRAEAERYESFYERVAELLDREGVAGNVRIAYRAFAEELLKLASRYAPTSRAFAVEADAISHKYYRRGFDAAVLRKIALLFGVSVLKLYWVVAGIQFNYRRPITITEESGNDLTDYQVLIELDSTNFDFSKVRAGGEDIRFADAAGNLLDFWIEEWDAAAERARLWVKVPSIPAGGTTKIYMYYGNPGIRSASDAYATFIRIIDGVVGAWHFDEGAGTIAHDTSGYDNDGTIYGATWVDGKFYKALSFDGVDDYVEVPHSSKYYEVPLTVCGWVRGSGFDEDWRVVAHIGDYPLANLNFAWNIRVNKGERALNFYTCDDSAFYGVSIPLEENELAFFCFVHDGSMAYAYKNGEFVEQDSIPAPKAVAQNLFIGIDSDLSDPWKGMVDEFFIFNVALSEEEISDLYHNHGYTTESYPGRVLVRKFVYPEPSVVVGAEETP